MVKGTQLAAVDEFLQPLLDRLEIRSTGVACVRTSLLGDFGSLLGIGLEGANDVHPVKGVQMVEMHDVVVEKLSAHEQVTDQPGVVGDLHLDRIVHAAYRGERVDVGTHTAGPLGEQPGIARIAVLEDHFQAAEHRGAAPRIADLAIGHFYFNSQVTFDSGDRIDNYTLSHMHSLLWLKFHSKSVGLKTPGGPVTGHFGTKDLPV